MPFLRYASNVGRSAKYALPQIIKNRLPSVSALTSQFTNKDQRETTREALMEVRGILKENVVDLMKTGLNNAKSELKTGDFNRTDAVEESFSEAFGFDESMFDNSFLNEAGGDGDEGGSFGEENRGIAAAAAVGASAGVQAAAARLGDSPAARVSAEANMATARFSRAQIGANIAVGNMVRGAIMANTHVLAEVHRFQTSVQQAYYAQSLSHQTAMMGLQSEVVETLRELKGAMATAVVASDQIAAGLAGRETDYGRVFGNDGGFDVNAYIGIVNRRLKDAVGDGSAFSMMGRTIAAAPMTMAFQQALEAAIPKAIGKQLDQLEDFASSLGSVLNERLKYAAGRMGAKGTGFGQFAEKALNSLSVGTESVQAGPDLSNIVRGKAVAFDGYAHRSLVEVIPSHLADIHSELVSMRKGFGHEAIGDRKTYDFKAGRFASERATRAKFEADAEQKSLSHFSRTRQLIGDGGDATVAKEINRVLARMRDQEVSIKKGGVDTFEKQFADLADSWDSQGLSEEAAALRKNLPRLVDARRKHGSTLSYEMTAGQQRALASKASMYADVGQEEGTHRMMYSSQMVDPTTGKLSGKGIGDSPTPNLADPFAGMAVGQDIGREVGLSDQKVFRDAQGHVTLSSLIQAPAVMASKAINGFETKISDMLFGDNDGQRGFFGKIYDGLMGPLDGNGRRTGVVGRMVDTIRKDLFEPLKHSLLGDGTPGGDSSSFWGRTKSWFTEQAERANKYLFGTESLDQNGNAVRSGGLFGGVVRQLAGAKAKMGEFLMGKGEDGSRKGILVSLRERFDSVTSRLGVMVFGDIGADGKRSGGMLGSTIQKGKDFVSRMTDTFNKRVVAPLQTLVFGTTDADGKRSGGIFGGAVQKGKDLMSRVQTGFTEQVFNPIKRTLFGFDFQRRGRNGEMQTVHRKGVLEKVMNTFQTSLINPTMEAMFGKQSWGKDKDGNRVLKRSGGAWGQLKESLSTAFAPMKDALVGEGGILPQIRKGMADTWTDLKKSLFGEKASEKTLAQTIGEKFNAAMERVGGWIQKRMEPLTKRMEQAGKWMSEKVIEPFGKWLSDPETGIIGRASRKLTAVFDSVNKSLFGEAGIVGKIQGSIDRFFYGDKEKGTDGFVKRVVEPAREFIKMEIWEPLKTNVKDMWDRSISFVHKEMIEPLKGTLRPFIEEAKNQWRLMKEWAKGPVWESIKGIGSQINMGVKDAFGVSFTDILRNNILDPIKEALGGAKKFLMTAFSSVLKMPVNALRGISDELKISQIKRGLGGYMSADERARLLGKFNVDPASVPAGSGSSIRTGSGAANPAQTASAGAPGSATGGGADANGTTAQDGTVEGGKRRWWQRGEKSPAGQSAGSAPANATGTAAVSQRSAVRDPSIASPAVDASAQAAVNANVRQAKGNGKSGSGDIRMTRTPEEINSSILAASKATADNTSNIYQFVSRHLHGVGKNVERIVQHFRISDTEVGGNDGSKRKGGFLAKLRRMATNPIGFVYDMVGGVFEGLYNGLKRATKMATDLVMLPFRALGKGVSLLNSAVGAIREHAGSILGALKDAFLGILKTAASVAGIALKMAGTLVVEAGKAIGGALKGLAQAIPAVAKGLTSLAVGTVKVAGTIAGTVLKLTGTIATSVVKMGGEMIRTAASVTKDVVTGLAKVTFDAIGGVFKAVTGRTGKNAKSRITPVFVTGGFLAGTKGGAKSLTEAEASVGAGGVLRMAKTALLGAGMAALTGFNPLLGAAVGGGFASLTARRDKEHQEKTQANYQKSLLGASRKTSEHLSEIRSGFRSFGSMMAMAIPAMVSGIGAMAGFFTKGKFISAIAGLLARFAGGNAGPGVDTPDGRRRGGRRSPGRTIPKGKLLGGGLAGLAGVGVGMAADEFMEDGAAKTAVKTGGAMLSYGATGAMIGSVIPGLGTAVGAGIGAGVGAVVENWDSIKGWVGGIPSRATGGPLGRNGTLVGELGPELLDGNGNVISGAGKGSPFQNPAMVKAAQEREDSVSAILSRIESNTRMMTMVANSGFSMIGEYIQSKSGGALSSIFKKVGGAVRSAANNVAWKGQEIINSDTFTNALDSVKSTFGGGSKGNRAILVKAMKEAGITSPNEQAMFLAQMDHESGGFKRMSESFSYAPDRLLKVFPKYFRSIEEASAVRQQGPAAIAERVYGGRMGNEAPGDGFKYHGRGFIQLTGRANYEAAGKALGLDLVNKPELAEDPANAAKVALWYWQSRGVSKSAQIGDVARSTKLINGGLNGLSDRQSKFRSYLTMAKNGELNVAMNGGKLGALPTLVGEREPEVVGPDGRIHRTVSDYLHSPNSDASSLAVNAAIKEAERRASKGPDNSGASGALAKIASAAQATNGNMEELLKQILNAMLQVADNTGKALDVEPGSKSSNVNNQNNTNHNGNVFSLGGGSSQGSSQGMSDAMRALVRG